jgi:GTP cyclohydrolase II
MSMSPSLSQLIARARTDLRSGLPVVLTGDGTWLAAAAEGLAPDTLIAFRALGAPVLALTTFRADTLKARAYDGDLARIALRSDMDATTIARLADPKDDLTRPMSGPFVTLRDGTSAPHRAALALLKSARLLPAAIVVETDTVPGDLTHLPLADLAEALSQAPDYREVVAGRVPMELAKAGRVHVFRSRHGSGEHVAVEIGQPARNTPVLTRLHSACFTGDVLGSLKCDCGPQLHAALAAMGTAGAGILLYLDQEGRGIGLANKMRAYSLQDQGFDTVEANHRLGFKDDERDFRIGADILRKLGFSSVRLMTNNPRKVSNMEKCGITVVERVPLAVGRSAHNADYLDTKAKKSGHIL